MSVEKIIMPSKSTNDAPGPNFNDLLVSYDVIVWKYGVDRFGLEIYGVV